MITDWILELKDNENFINNVHSLIGYILKNKKWPYKSNIGRLLVLNKNPDATPNLNNVRPLNMISVIMKILDTCLGLKVEEFI